MVNVDEPGPKSYKVSGPQTMLDKLQALRGAGEPSQAATVESGGGGGSQQPA